MEDTIFLDSDLVTNTVTNLAERSAVIKQCKEKLETLDAHYTQTEDQKGYTADEIIQENRRLLQAASTLYALNEYYRDLIDKARKRILKHDEDITTK